MKTIDTEKLNEVINEIICENPVITYPEQDAYDDGYNDGLNRALSELEDLAVEIICCKDCKHSVINHGRYCIFGDCLGCLVADDFFCKYGERKESNS